MRELGFIGLGRMGGSMVRRLARAGIRCVGYDRNATAVAAVVQPGVTGASSPEELVAALAPPRAVWLMVPAAVIDGEIARLRPLLSAGDILIDGGNSDYRDSIRRARELRAAGIHFVDVGTSGGVAGGDVGYCLMAGGEDEVVKRLTQVFSALAPGADRGYLHCGPHGAGHFVKMVHNGIEYGVMAAYAEGFNILRHGGIGREDRHADAETSPLAHPEAFQFDFDLPGIAELWRHGSVIRSWLLDLTARALADDPSLDAFGGRVSDSGEGRWTVETAVAQGVPAPVITAALFSRFESRGNAGFGNRLLSAMRKQFGGHEEKKPGKTA
jgi:6-phosphogluconate dehydrogenase